MASGLLCSPAVPPVVLLLVAALCSLISRCLLIKAAWSVSKRWGFGIFLPFGPYFFRRQYPDDVQLARKFQLAAIPCVFIYVLISPEMIPDTRVAFVRVGPPGQEKLALSLGGHVFGRGGNSASSAPADAKAEQPTFSAEERRFAHEREMKRLAEWSEALRIRRRDLLKSDVEGARAYDREATAYNAALAKANEESTVLASFASR